jgi:hypothetical protein
VSKIYRPEYGDFKRLKEIETEIREEFAVRGGLLSEFKPIGDDAGWDWYFLMQHFGAPTRLLDWTEGSLIGLYFAVKDNPGYYDAAVWVLDPYELNKFKPIVGKNNVYAPNSCVTPKDHKKTLKRWLPELNQTIHNLPPRTIAIYPAQTHQRMSAQRSCFTIHGRDLKGLQRYAGGNNKILKKIIIPSHCIIKIKEELGRCGIDEVTIYPDLEGLGKCVSKRWKLPPDYFPHQDVYTRLRPSLVDKGGVGVFAIKPIKKDTKLFKHDSDEMYWVNRHLLTKEQEEIRKLYDDFAVYKANRDQYGSPTNFNRLTISWYINNSKHPNVRCDKNYDFVTLKNIKKGDELTVDYSKYSDVVPLWQD